MKKKIFLVSSLLFFLTFSAQAADLKQLAEQLVNKADNGAKGDVLPVDNDCEGDDGSCGQMMQRTIREGGRTVGAGQATEEPAVMKMNMGEAEGMEMQRTGRNPQTGKEIKIPAKARERMGEMEGGEPEEMEVRNRVRSGQPDYANMGKSDMGEFVRVLAAEARDSGRQFGELVSEKAKELVGKKQEKGLELVEVENKGEAGATVRLKAPAKLFGFIPVSLPVEVDITDTDNPVKVKKPFYSFLFSFDENNTVQSLFGLLF